VINAFYGRRFAFIAATNDGFIAIAIQFSFAALNVPILQYKRKSDDKVSFCCFNGGRIPLDCSTIKYAPYKIDTKYEKE